MMPGGLGAAIGVFGGAPPEVGPHVAPGTCELPLEKEKGTWHGGDQQAGRAPSVGREDRGRPGLIVVLQESDQVPLVLRVGRKVVPHRAGAVGDEAVVEALVVAVIETL